MPKYLATKPMTLAGRQLQPGDRVPMESLKPNLRRQLIEQRRVAPDHVAVVKRGRGRPRKEG